MNNVSYQKDYHKIGIIRYDFEIYSYYIARPKIK